MKINGRVATARVAETLVVPRQDGDMVFKAIPVTDFSDFNALCPEPKPPEILRPGGERVSNVEDPSYKAAKLAWADQRTAFMIIKSLAATEGLEFETVNIADSATWGNWRKEMEKVLVNNELNMLLNIVITANGMSVEKIEEATKSFLAAQRVKQSEQASLTPAR